MSWYTGQTCKQHYLFMYMFTCRSLICEPLGYMAIFWWGGIKPESPHVILGVWDRKAGGDSMKMTFQFFEFLNFEFPDILVTYRISLEYIQKFNRKSFFSSCGLIAKWTKFGFCGLPSQREETAREGQWADWVTDWLKSRHSGNIPALYAKRYPWLRVVRLPILPLIIKVAP